MKYIWILLIAVLFTNCQKDTGTKTNINVTVHSKVDDNVIIIDELRKLPLELENGKGTYTLTSNTPRYIHIGTGNYFATAYIIPGQDYDYEVTLEHNEDNRVVSVDVKPCAEPYDKLQDYLMRYAEPGAAIEADDFMMEEKDFLKIVETSIDNYTKNLQKLDLPEQFKKDEALRIKYALLMTLADHPIGYTYLNEIDPKTYAMTDSVKSMLKNAIYTTDNVRNVLYMYGLFVDKFYQVNVESNAKTFEQDLLLKFDDWEKNFTNAYNCDVLKFYTLKKHTIDNRGIIDDKIKELYSRIADKDLRAELQQTYEKLSTVQSGVSAENWTFKDQNGKKISLTDLKGKLVVIDVWASWCKPCIQAMPYLKQLEENYKLRPVHFVTISIDRNETDWKNKLQELGLSGINLLCDDIANFKSDYGIVGIPHTILIDAEGNIVEKAAPRPGDVKLEMLINKYLK